MHNVPTRSQFDQMLHDLQAIGARLPADQQVIAALRAAEGPLCVGDFPLCRRSPTALQALLLRMVKAGQIAKAGRLRYALAPEAPTAPPVHYGSAD